MSKDDPSTKISVVGLSSEQPLPVLEETMSGRDSWGSVSLFISQLRKQTPVMGRDPGYIQASECFLRVGGIAKAPPTIPQPLLTQWKRIKFTGVVIQGQ